MPRQVVARLRDVLGKDDREIALHEPEFGGAEWDLVKNCLDSGWVSTAGSYVTRFERDLAELTGAQSVAATVSGTAALHVALLLVGVTQNDEVIVPALTFVATANAVVYCGAVPHFADCDPQTLGLDADKLRRHLAAATEQRRGGLINRRTGRRIAAVVCMHTFGHPCNLEDLEAVCTDFRLPLVEDAAEAVGSSYEGNHVGTRGQIGALSFNGNKIVTTGGGGAVLTNDLDLGERARHLSSTARIPHRWEILHDEIGFNYRLPNLNAALGCAQLEQLPRFLKEKRRLAEAYIEAFSSMEGFRVLVEPPRSRSNYWLNTLILDDASQRDPLLAAVNDSGFGARPAWQPMHRLPTFSEAPRMDLSTTENLQPRIINLPSSARLGAALGPGNA